MESPEREVGAKSSTSKTSISVKLPSAGDDQRKKTSSPALRRTPTGGTGEYRKSPSLPAMTGEFVATLEGQEFGQYRQLTTPVSSTRSPTPGKHLRQPAVTEKE